MNESAVPVHRRRPLTLPWFIVLLSLIVVGVLYVLRPEADKRPAPSARPINVDVLELEAQVFEPKVRSYGLVEPRVRSRLVAQVSGRVVVIADAFRDGGFFRKGEPLLQLEDADYRIEVQVASANRVEAERQLEEEKARAAQASQDWLRLGNDDQASPLVLREPQVKAAQARLQSATARLEQARLNLARTRIEAPFDGRVLSTAVDLGQAVNNNALLGEIYAIDAVEIRLPIKNSDIPLLQLPESYSHLAQSASTLPPVRVLSQLAGDTVWEGKLVRTSSALDPESRQLYVVAQIDKPFGKKAEGRLPLKIGEYVTAEIPASPIPDALIIPNRAIYQGRYVYLLQGEVLARTDIQVRWQDEQQTLVASGLQPGDLVVISPLGQVSSGTRAQRNDGGDGGNAAIEAADKGDMASRIPPERMARLKARAEREGRPLQELLDEVQAKRAGNGSQRP